MYEISIDASMKFCVCLLYYIWGKKEGGDILPITKEMHLILRAKLRISLSRNSKHEQAATVYTVYGILNDVTPGKPRMHVYHHYNTFRGSRIR